MPPEPIERADLPADAVRAELDRVLASRAFASSQRHRDFLRHVVTRWLEQPDAEVKETALALDVFGRDPKSFDPRLDTIVRVEARRLRARLDDYYAGEGASNPHRIVLAKGSYLPAVHERAATGSSPEPGRPGADSDLQRTRRVWRLSPLVSSLVAAILVAAVAVPALLWRSGHTDAAAALVEPSIAVLPFDNLSGDQSLDPFIDGLVDEITDALTRVAGLKVIARTSAFQFKGKAADVRAIGRALGVSSVLEGSVQRSEGRLKFIVQLNRTDEGSHLWSQVFVEPQQEVFALQTRITKAIAATLVPALEAQVGGSRGGTANWVAWDAYSKGLFAMRRVMPASYADAIAFFDDAIRLDPRFARALGMRGIIRLHSVASGTMDPLAKQQSLDDIESAIRLDPGQACLLDGVAAWAYLDELDWPRAEALYKRALDACPSVADPHAAYAGALMLQGRDREADAEYARALRLNPLDLTTGLYRAMVPMLAGRPREAIDRLEAFERANRDHPLVLATLVRAHLAAGDNAAALRVSERLSASDVSMGKLCSTFARIAGHVANRRQDLARSLAADLAASIGKTQPYQVAVAYALIDDAEPAAAWLLTAIRTHDGFASYLTVDPALDGIRTTPAFRTVWNAVPRLTRDLKFPGPIVTRPEQPREFLRKRGQ